MISPCDDCYELSIEACEDFCITPDGGITAGQEYLIKLTDKFNAEYTQQITANGYGGLCVDMTGFPDGFFNPFAGVFTIQVFEADDTDTPLQLIFGSLEYECISLTAKSVTETNVS